MKAGVNNAGCASRSVLAFQFLGLWFKYRKDVMPRREDAEKERGINDVEANLLKAGMKEHAGYPDDLERCF